MERGWDELFPPTPPPPDSSGGLPLAPPRAPWTQKLEHLGNEESRHPPWLGTVATRFSCCENCHSVSLWILTLLHVSSAGLCFSG